MNVLLVVLFVTVAVVILIAVHGIVEEKKEDKQGGMPDKNRIVLGAMLILMGILGFVAIRNPLRWPALILPLLAGAYVVASVKWPEIRPKSTTAVGIAAAGIAVLVAGAAGGSKIKEHREAGRQAEDREADRIRNGQLKEEEQEFQMKARDWMNTHYEDVSFPVIEEGIRIPKSREESNDLKDSPTWWKPYVKWKEEYNNWDNRMRTAAQTVYSTMKEGGSGDDHVKAFYEVWVQIAVERDSWVVSKSMVNKLNYIEQYGSLGQSLAFLVHLIVNVNWPLYKNINLPNDESGAARIEQNIQDILAIDNTKTIDIWVTEYTTHKPFDISFEQLEQVKTLIGGSDSFPHIQELVNNLRSRRYDCLLLDEFYSPHTPSNISEKLMRDFSSHEHADLKTDLDRLPQWVKPFTQEIIAFYHTLKQEHPEWKYSQGVFNCIAFLKSTYENIEHTYQLWKKYALKLKELTRVPETLSGAESMLGYNYLMVFMYPQIPHFTYYILMSDSIPEKLKLEIAKTCYDLVKTDQQRPLTEDGILKRIGEFTEDTRKKIMRCAPYTQQQYQSFYDTTIGQTAIKNTLHCFEPYPYNKTAQMRLDLNLDPTEIPIDELLDKLSTMIDFSSYGFYDALLIDKLLQTASHGRDAESAIIQGLIPSIQSLFKNYYDLKTFKEGMLKIRTTPDLVTDPEMRQAVRELVNRTIPNLKRHNKENTYDDIELEVFFKDVDRSGVNFIEPPDSYASDAPTRKYICDLVEMLVEFYLSNEGYGYLQSMQFVSQYVFSNLETFKDQYKSFVLFWKFISKFHGKRFAEVSDTFEPSNDEFFVFNLAYSNLREQEKIADDDSVRFYVCFGSIIKLLLTINESSPVWVDIIREDALHFKEIELVQLANAALTKYCLENYADDNARNGYNPNVVEILERMKSIANHPTFRQGYSEKYITEAYTAFKTKIDRVVDELQQNAAYTPYVINRGEFEAPVAGTGGVPVAGTGGVAATMKAVIEQTQEEDEFKIPRLFKLYTLEVAPFEKGKDVLKKWVQNALAKNMSMENLAQKQGRLGQMDLPIILAMTRIINRWESDEPDWIQNLKVFTQSVRFRKP